MSHDNLSIGIIGGGISGSTIGLLFSELGYKVILFEKEHDLLAGPPICHLHAGGNLYRELCDEECLILLKESIDFARLYPEAIEHRPTVIALPRRDSGTVETLFPRLKKLQSEYQRLIELDPKNKVLGEPIDYYRIYNKAQLEKLKLSDNPMYIKCLDDWMVAVAKHLDLEKLKMPLILVQEYGLNKSRLASLINLSISKNSNCQFKNNSVVIDLKRISGKWYLTYIDQHKIKQVLTCDYLINAAGFKTGIIDDLLNIKRSSMVEFKAAYLAKWAGSNTKFWPEVIFHGKRGTPEGMAQFTPLNGDYFLLHGMTNEITLFENGLAINTSSSAQPKLPPNLLKKIDQGWDEADVKERTRKAIKHLAYFIPGFASATQGGEPLFGAQQIPGKNPEFRTANVSFGKDEYSTYSRCEVVKASSVLSAYCGIIANMQQQGFIGGSILKQGYCFPSLQPLTDEEILRKAQELAVKHKNLLAISHGAYSQFANIKGK